MYEPVEEIKKIVYKHECREIKITYMPGKTTPTEMDEQFLAAYLKLHDYQWKMNEFADRLYKAFLGIDKRINALREQLAKATATFNAARAIADKLSADSYIVTEANMESLTESQAKTFEEIKQYRETMVEVYEDQRPHQEALNEYIVADEDEANEVYEAFNNINYQHSADYINNSIDIVEFEKEHEMFYAYTSVHEDRRRNLIATCHKALDNYNMLHAETTALFGIWDEFLKRCSLLRIVANLHAKALVISNN
jgi:hypothetical protein